MYTIARIRIEHASLFKASKKRVGKRDYKSLYGLSMFQIHRLTTYFKDVKHPAGYSNFSLKHILWSLYDQSLDRIVELDEANLLRSFVNNCPLLCTINGR